MNTNTRATPARTLLLAVCTAAAVCAHHRAVLEHPGAVSRGAPGAQVRPSGWKLTPDKAFTSPSNSAGRGSPVALTVMRYRC